MRRVLRSLFVIVVVLGLGLAAAFVWLLEPTPRTTGGGPPRPEDVAATRTFVREVRAEAMGEPTPESDGVVVVTEAEANGILRVAARMFPAGHAEVRVLDGRVYGVASLPVPWPGGARWLNVEGVAPAFEGRPRLEMLSVGGVGLPPAPFVEAARVGANVVLGGRAGDVFLGSAERLEIEGGALRFTMALDEADKKDFMRNLFGALRGEDMPGLDRVDAYYGEVRRALDEGRLPLTGSYLPHLRFVLSRVVENSTDATLSDEYTAAIFGLAKACGARDFAMVVGRLVDDPLDSFGTWRTTCEEVTFAGRVDTRRHFTTAAAIRAASNRGVSVSVGEFKELYDSIGWEKGGFDFSDIGANQSGIRLSDLVMGGTVADLSATLEMMQAEGDVLVDVTRLPQIMPRPVFEARFGTISSPEYAAQIAEIEALIDEVPIHRPR